MNPMMLAAAPAPPAPQAGAPSIVSITPNSGPVTGGQLISITGAGFQNGAKVQFGSSTPVNSTFVGPTLIRASVPANSGGSVTVRVINPDTQFGSLVDGYTYIVDPTPTIATITPDSGIASGGRFVTITGTNFQNGATVKFGANSGTGTTFVGPTEIRVFTPAGAAGSVTVQVVNPNGLFASKPNGYAYIALSPAIDTVTPTSGVQTGSRPVTITGSNFQNGSTIKFGVANATGVTFVSPTEIRAITPPNPVATVSVQVISPNGLTATKPSAYTYLPVPPVISAVTPDAGVAAGNRPVTITGANFLNGATVKFGANNAASVTFVSTTEIRVITPPAAASGSVAVQVINQNGLSGTLSNAYSYLPQNPTVTQVSPNSGTAAGGRLITITGTNFMNGAAVKFDGVNGTNSTFVSPTEIRIVTPQHTAGLVAIQVVNPNGLTATLPNAYTFTAGAAPTFAMVQPNFGPAMGGTFVSLHGAGFASGATVRFGNGSQLPTTFVSSTRLTTVVPAGTPGVVDVTITNPDGFSALKQLAYAFDSPTSGGGGGEPVPTKTFLNANFEDDEFGGFLIGTPGGEDNECVIQAGVGLGGSKGTKCTLASPEGAARLHFQYTNPSNVPLTEPNGLFQRWAFRFEDIRQTDGGVKLLLNRSDWNAPDSDSAWLQVNVNYGGGALDEFYVEAEGEVIPTGNTGFTLHSNEWVCAQTHFKEELSGFGRARVWLDRGCTGNWVLVVDDSRISYGSTNPANALSWEIGAVWSDVGARPLVMYIDDAASTNGWINNLANLPPVIATSPSPDANDVILFQDGFETGDLSKWDDVNFTRYFVETNPLHIKSGTRSLRGLVSPTIWWGEMSKWYMPGQDEVFVKFHTKFEVDFQMINMHFVIQAGNHITDQWSAGGKSGIKPNGSDFFITMLDPEYSYDNFGDLNLHPFQFYTYYPDMACEAPPCFGNLFRQPVPKEPLVGGQWHEVVFRVKMNTIGQHDGEQTLWVDGVKKIDITGLRWRDTTDLRLNQFSIHLYVQDGAPKTEHVWFDNFIIWSPR